MPAIASLEELKGVEDDLKTLKITYPEAYAALVLLLRKHRKIGYKNICKLLLEEATPEKLKGLVD